MHGLETIRAMNAKADAANDARDKKDRYEAVSRFAMSLARGQAHSSNFDAAGRLLWIAETLPHAYLSDEITSDILQVIEGMFDTVIDGHHVSLIITLKHMIEKVRG